MIWRNTAEAACGAPAGYKCDYAGKTDHTRKAESPDGCTYYLRGDIVTDDRTARRLYRKVMAKRKAAGLA